MCGDVLCSTMGPRKWQFISVVMIMPESNGKEEGRPFHCPLKGLLGQTVCERVFYCCC